MPSTDENKDQIDNLERRFEDHQHEGTDSNRVSPIDLSGFPIFTSVPTHNAEEGTIVLYKATASSDYRIYIRLDKAWKKVGDVDFTTTVFTSPLTTKGDIFTYDSDDARLPVGTNDDVLISDSAEDTGLKWVALSPKITSIIPNGLMPFVETGVVPIEDNTSMRVSAFIMPFKMDIGKVSVYLTTNNTVGDWDFGVFDESGTRLFTASFGTLSGTGLKSKTITETLNPGIYYFGLVGTTTPINAVFMGYDTDASGGSMATLRNVTSEPNYVGNVTVSAGSGIPASITTTTLPDFQRAIAFRLDN